MGKKASSRNKRDVGNNGGEVAGAARPVRSPMKPFIERLIDKVEAVHAKTSEVALALEKRGAPVAIVKSASDFVAACEKYRESFYELRSSGWQPPSAEGFNPEVGTKVAINPKFLDLYVWIPGVADGTANLVVTKVSEGKRPQLLVAAAGGATPCGFIPKSHLVPR